MKIRQFFLGVVSVFALVVCAHGFTRASGPYDQDVTVAYAPEQELLVSISTTSGVLSHTVGVAGGTKAVEYRRTLATTLPWSVETNSDEVYSYYKVIPAAEDAPEPESRSCCYFTCSGYIYAQYSTPWRCVGSGNSCQICDVTCVSSNEYCPRTTRLQQVLD